VDDEHVVRAIVAGDAGALATLYDRYRRPLFSFCARMLGDAESARDVVQDVFLGIHERPGVLDGVRQPRSWLFTVARRRCLNGLRDRATRARLDAVTPIAIAADAVAGGLEAGQESALVRRAIARLPDDLREVLVLREYQDLSYREIAAITEASESAVKSRLFRARQAVLEQLRPLWRQGAEPCGAKKEG
jgi:RNA polymerase sigma-70 factor, ECF subfamily